MHMPLRNHINEKVGRLVVSMGIGYAMCMDRHELFSNRSGKPIGEHETSHIYYPPPHPPCMILKDLVAESFKIIQGGGVVCSSQSE
jgi:hypothetical protein